MLSYKYEVFSHRNTKCADKPNEDFVAYSKNYNFGMILDGVSRDRENGAYPNPSPVTQVNKIFSDAIMSIYTEINTKGIQKIYDMIYVANTELKEFNCLLGHRFPAGTVGIVFDIQDNIFNYGYIGDCYAIIIRDNLQRIFTECQTEMIAKQKNEYSSDEIRFDICNHINHPCGYGVWDGNESAMDFVKYGSIKIKEGDVLFMYTDGLKFEVSKKSNKELKESLLEELFLVKEKANMDDRSCLRITVSEKDNLR